MKTTDTDNVSNELSVHNLWMMGKRFRNPDGLVPNVAALAYVFTGYGFGLAALFADAWLLNAAGVLLLAHALVIAAYLIHECAHNTIFSDSRWNARLGSALLWFTGACYGRYEDIRHKHFRHHVDRADVVAFDFRPLLLLFPRLLRLVLMLEWAIHPGGRSHDARAGDRIAVPAGEPP